MDEERITDPYLNTMKRKNALTSWLINAINEEEEGFVLEDEDGADESLRSVFCLMTSGRLAKAVDAAMLGGMLFLCMSFARE